jgi:hypothetical protein
MARKRFVLMCENKTIVFESLCSPYVAMNKSTFDTHPDTKYFIGAWVNKRDFYPTILDGGFQNREHAEATVREWNRLESDSWIPEDSI